MVREMIPRRVFHIWLSDKPEGALVQRCLYTWRKLGCEVVEITLENCDRSSLVVREALALGTTEGRVKANDYLRVQYLYQHGGIYLDNDVEVLKNFDDLLENQCFLGAEDDFLVNMAVLGAQPGNWFLRECLEAMNAMGGAGSESPVAFSLGAVTRVLTGYGWKGDEEFEINGVKVYPSNYFYPTHWSKRVSRADGKAKGAHTIHHWKQSWNEMVSVVVPTYNYGRYLPQCLKSIQAQTYKNIETIVIDDGSTDNTREVAAAFPWVQYHYQPNAGLSAARNAGIRRARGQFIQPLDSDDILHAESVEKCVTMMDQADIVCPGQQEFEGGSKFYQRKDSNLTLPHFVAANRIHCASMYRKKAWVDVGGYDEGMRDGYEDWDFWVRMLAKDYTVGVINEPLFFYRVHADSMMRSTKTKHESVRSYMLDKYRGMGIHVS